MDTIITTPKTVGRPKKPLVWPSGKFTINDLKKLVANEPDAKLRVTRVGLQNKVRQAVADGSLVQVGSERASSLGRPSAVYQKASEVVAAQAPALAGLAALATSVRIVDDKEDGDPFAE